MFLDILFLVSAALLAVVCYWLGYNEGKIRGGKNV